QARLWQRRSLAVLGMILALVLLFILPLTLAISTIADNADSIVDWVKGLVMRGPPRLPDWVANLPIVGPRISTAWNELVQSGVAAVQPKLAPYAKSVTGWLFEQAGVVGALTLQFVLTIIIAAVMYASGEEAAAVLRRFGHRLGGPRGEDAVVLAGKAIRA